MVPAGSKDHAARLEELAHRTWPCVEEEWMGSWLLRAAHGFTRRANSVLAIGSPRFDLDQSLEDIATWSRSRGIEPCVKITPLAPSHLDASLAARGWTIATPALVCRWSTVGDRACRDLPSWHLRCPADSCHLQQSAGLDKLGHRAVSACLDGADHRLDLPNLSLSPHPSREWLECLFSWDGTAAANVPRHQELFGRMDAPVFLSWREHGRLLALAVAARDGRDAHLYDLVVAPEARGRGVGTRFLRALRDRLAEEGVRELVLQVLEANLPARALYGKTDFVIAYPYHYRVAPIVQDCATGTVRRRRPDSQGR